MKALITFAVLISASLNAYSLEPLVLEQNDFYPLGKHIEILEDVNGKLTIDDIKLPEYASSFIKSGIEIPSFGFTSSAYWIKFSIDCGNRCSENWLLEFQYPLMDEIELYTPKKNGSFLRYTTGYSHPFSQRDVLHRNFVFNLDLSKNKITYFYLRLKNEDRMDIPLTLWSSKTFQEKDHVEQYVLGIYFGIIFVMFLFTLLLFIQLREITFINYIFFIISYGFFQLTQNGIFFEYFTPVFLEKYNHYIPFSISITLIATVLFSQTFLNTHKYTPKIDKFLMGLKILLGITIPVNFFLRYDISIQIQVVLSLVTVSSILATGVIIFLKKYRPAKYFLFAWSVILIGAMIYALKVIAIIPTNLFTTYAIQVGSVIQFFILALGIGDRINLMAMERNEAQQNAILNLEKADKLKDEFLANTSHELKTPLNGIIGIAESLLDGAGGALPDKAVQNLKMIISSGKRLSSLVNDILDFSKINNNDLELNLKSTDLWSLVEITLELSRPLTMTKNIKLVNSVQGDLPVISVDENRLQQVLFNLIGNAIKFTESGQIEVSSELIKHREKEYVSIHITDTGIGIPEDKLDEIFMPFTQADGSISRIYGGTGLGLSITKNLIELHGGTINVDSKPGKGSRFTFTLPMKNDNIEATEILLDSSGNDKLKISMLEVKKTEEERPSHGLDITGLGNIYDMEKKEISTILIVDDDPINLQVLENHLTLHNYSVIKSLSGHEALNKIEEGLVPDLIILDIMMPRISGYEVARILREKYSLFDLPIIMLTAKTQIADMITGLEAGANDYLSKPFDKRELLARVKTLITLKDAIKESQKLLSIEQELDLAKKIQQSTIPKELPRLSNFDIQAMYMPMESIGGDFYDFHVIDDKRISALITDVSGHGIPSALIASMVKIIFCMQKSLADRPDRFLLEMNQILMGNTENQFLTAGYVYIDLEKKKLYHASAGHLPLIIFKRKQNTLIELKPHGMIMGWFSQVRYDLADINIDSGDRIILYTDGITEACNKEKKMLGDSIFKDLILHHSNMKAADFISCLMIRIKEWIGVENSFEDDITIIVIDIM
ncbi:MAG: SpoIIE family protein phosphatase [Spirochaetes bacterium]|jgi:two-component system sensor histidine kinase ChiS|nr:SpoIIE family protein phosphatase [Spirochaetota bacterium]